MHCFLLYIFYLQFYMLNMFFFFFSSRRRHTRYWRDWSSDVCSSDLMAKSPSRIDLLELDIDLRLADLWREAGEITEWSIDVVAAFMRAAYGKGYCDEIGRAACRGRV